MWGSFLALHKILSILVAVIRQRMKSKLAVACQSSFSGAYLRGGGGVPVLCLSAQ